MDERYRQIYGVIYSTRVREAGRFIQGEYFERFGQGRPELGLGPIIDNAITLSERQRGDGARLREDAKALLAVNFHDLVFVPLVVGGVPSEEVDDDVQRDMKMLVTEAEADRSTLADPEISGHAIIDSLSRNWGNLRISRYNLWERSSSPPESSRPEWELR
jgi:hypothetical protein